MPQGKVLWVGGHGVSGVLGDGRSSLLLEDHPG